MRRSKREPEAGRSAEDQDPAKVRTTLSQNTKTKERKRQRERMATKASMDQEAPLTCSLFLHKITSFFFFSIHFIVKADHREAENGE